MSMMLSGAPCAEPKPFCLKPSADIVGELDNEFGSICDPKDDGTKDEKRLAKCLVNSVKDVGDVVTAGLVF